jgi:hypothetical protein
MESNLKELIKDSSLQQPAPFFKWATVSNVSQRADGKSFNRGLLSNLVPTINGCPIDKMIIL